MQRHNEWSWEKSAKEWNVVLLVMNISKTNWKSRALWVIEIWPHQGRFFTVTPPPTTPWRAHGGHSSGSAGTRATCFWNNYVSLFYQATSGWNPFTLHGIALHFFCEGSGCRTLKEVILSYTCNRHFWKRRLFLDITHVVMFIWYQEKGWYGSYRKKFKKNSNNFSLWVWSHSLTLITLIYR